MRRDQLGPARASVNGKAVDVEVSERAGHAASAAVTPQEMPVRFEVNGKKVAVEVEPRMTLVDCLRHELRLTGTHVGCEHGVCGACTILVDGAAGSVNGL